jgi:endogenous inhibitor of DNA gyrase (YacG/DUF329 family)
MTGREDDERAAAGEAGVREGARGSVRCAICGQPVDPTRRSPLCSERCAQIDLGRWLGGAYRVVEGPAEIDQPLGESGGEE